MDIDPVVASDEEIDAAIARFYGASDDSIGKMIQDITEGEVEIGNLGKVDAIDDGAAVDADAPIIKLVNGLIVEAFKARASDIHLEPLAKSFRVRYRIDGVLIEQKNPPKRLQASIISRLKIQANMSISDIPLEPLAKSFRVRYRIDGVLIEQKNPPKRLQASIISRLKIQANMSISEHRIPQ